MATLHKDIFVSASRERVWDAVRDVGALHTRLVPGFVSDCRLDGEVRTVTFSHGMVVQEPIVSIDDNRCRLAWGLVGGPLTHYNGVMEVIAEGDGCRVRWTSDLLPHELTETISAMQDQGLETLKRTFEQPPT